MPRTNGAKGVPRQFSFRTPFKIVGAAVVVTSSVLFLVKECKYLEDAIHAAKKRRNNVPTLPGNSSMASMKSEYPPDAIPFQDEHGRTGFCVSWDTSTNIDEWWTHHPTYELHSQSISQQCFRLIHDEKHRALLDELYKIQFHSAVPCDQMYSAGMINSGWGADLTYVVDALLHALRWNEPVKINMVVKWQYAAGRPDHQNTTKPVCPAADISCYMLPFSPCSDPQTLNLLPYTELGREYGSESAYFNNNATLRWMMEYATRPQAWIRRRVAEKVASIHLPKPCSVMHVRRADVVFHNKFSRRYHAIGEYIEAASDQLTRNVLLLTDDANAISEAKALHPDFNWVYLDRKRHKGAEGGWENQIPSKDPATEVIILLTTFELIKRCELLVRSHSALGSYFEAILAMANPDAKCVNLDSRVDRNYEVFSENNTETVAISKDYSDKNQSKEIS